MKYYMLPHTEGRMIVFINSTETFPSGSVGGYPLATGSMLVVTGAAPQQFLWNGKDWVSSVKNVLTVYGQATTEQVNTGLNIIPAAAGMTLKITDIKLQAIGGAAATATSVDIADTSGAVFAACPVASLTQNTVVGMPSLTITNIHSALAAGKGIKIQKAGGSLATATAINYIIQYCYE